jgi:hypothetical protein
VHFISLIRRGYFFFNNGNVGFKDHVDVREHWQRGAGVTKELMKRTRRGQIHHRPIIVQSSSKIQGHASANYPA